MSNNQLTDAPEDVGGQAAAVAFNGLPNLPPLVERNGEERFDYLRVEVSAGRGRDFAGRFLEGSGLVVGAVGGDGVERVGDSEDPGVERNLPAAQAERVARPVPPL